MKKRFLSILLTLCMVLSLLPTALAASEPVVVAPLNINVTTAKDDGLLVKNTEYYKNLDHEAASKLIADAQSGALKEPFVLVWHSRDCLNSKALMGIIRQYADSNKMTIYTIDEYNTLGGSVTGSNYLFKALDSAVTSYNRSNPLSNVGAAPGVVAATTITFPVTFAFDGKTLRTRQLAVPSFSTDKFVAYLEELNFIGLKHAGATSPVVFGAEATNLAEMQAKWAALKPQYTGELYSVKPKADNPPFTLGEVSEGIQRDGVNMANFVRYVAHLPADLVLDKALINQAQHGALTITVSGELSHTPKKNPSLSQEMYDLGYTSTTTSNIAEGVTEAHRMVLSFMSDSDTSNIGTVGHRRWIINPQLKKTAFGFSTHYGKTYSLMQVLDQSRTETVEYDFVSWPASGYHPVELFNKNDAWSASLNPDVFDVKKTGDIQVKLTAKDGTVTTFSDADRTKSGKYFNVETSNTGIPFAVIFRPLTGYKHGDAYSVEITGLYRKGTGKPVSIKYTTNFISLEGAEGEKDTTIVVPTNFSIEEQRAKWNQLKPRHTGSQFAEEPSIVAPYKLGKLADGAIKDASNMLQFMRYVAGNTEAMPPVKSNISEYQQYFAYRSIINNKPGYSVMPDYIPFEQADRQETGYSMTNVAYQGEPGSTLAENVKKTCAVTGMLADSFSKREIGGVDYYGMGFAYMPQGLFGLEVWSHSGKGDPNIPRLTWPAAGYHPIEFMPDTGKWSLVLDSDVYDYSKISEYKATVTGPNGTCTPHIYTGAACAVLLKGVVEIFFYPYIEEIYAGDAYKVKIENVYKIGDATPYTLEYTVNFFNLDPNAPLPAARIISMPATKVNIKEGNTYQIEYSIYPKQASQKVTYELSDSSLGTVSDTGLITAKKAGTLKITMRAGTISQVVTVYIRSTSPTKITLDTTVKTMTKNDTFQLSHGFIPADTAGMVTYSSSDSSIAAVTTNGLVTAKKAGTATITAKTGSLTATCAITVKNIVPSSLDLGAEALTLTAGKTLLLEPVVGPEGAVGAVTYTSSDSSVASVNSKGLITAKKAGKTTITGKVGSVAATMVITVEGKPVKGLTLGTKPTKTSYTVGETFDSAGFTATYSDGKTVKELKAGDMKFSSVSLATVGNKTVTATYDGLSVKFTVTVNKEVAPEEKPVEKPEEKPEQPVTPPAPATATATPSPTKLTVNGKSVSVDAYAINQNNYIKLRDLAYIINGTGKNFEVQWDGAKNAINLISKKGYTPTKNDMVPGDGQPKNATLATSTIYVDGAEKTLTAYVLGQNNYFKLRDVMQAFDVGVGYDGATGTATLDTGKSYEAPAGTTTTPGTGTSTGSTSDTLADGTYKIVPASASGFDVCISGASKNDKADLILWKNGDGGHREFKITSAGDGKYTLTLVHSGKKVTTDGQKGGVVYQGSGSTFLITRQSDGSYRIQDSASGLYMGVSGGKMENSSKLILWTEAGDGSQTFTLKKQ